MFDVDNIGVSWYFKKDYCIYFRVGECISVVFGENIFFEVLKKVKEGDVFVFQFGDYYVICIVEVLYIFSIVVVDFVVKLVFIFECFFLFSLENGGLLDLENFKIFGVELDDYLGNVVVCIS